MEYMCMIENGLGIKKDCYYDRDPRSEQFVCKIEVNKSLVASGEGVSKKIAKLNACQEFLRKLDEVKVTPRPHAKLLTKNQRKRMKLKRRKEMLKNGKANDDCAPPNAKKQKLTVSSRSKRAAKTKDATRAKESSKANESARAKEKHKVFDPNTFVLFRHQKGQATTSEIQQSAILNDLEVKFDWDKGNTRCKLILGSKEIVETDALQSKSKTHVKLCKLAIEKLAKRSYTIMVKREFQSESHVSRSDVTRPSALSGNRSKKLGKKLRLFEAMQKKLPADNIGNKLLHLMGWTGGGLGRDGDGITEPISVECKFDRKGLGMTNSSLKDFRKRIREVIEDYAKSNRDDALVFSKEFSKEERAIIHEEARKLHLRNDSSGKGEDRRVVVRAKYRRPMALVNKLLQSGGSILNYELIPPGGKSSS